MDKRKKPKGQAKHYTENTEQCELY